VTIKLSEQTELHAFSTDDDVCVIIRKFTIDDTEQFGVMITI